MKTYKIILAIILIVGLTAFFSPSIAKQASEKSPDQSKTTKSKSLSDSEKMKKVQPLKMELVQKGNKLYLKLNREAKGLWFDKRRKGVKSLGKGKFIEVTPYLSMVKRGKLTFVVEDTAGQMHTRKLPVSKYAFLLKPEKLKSGEKKKSSKTIQKQPGKEIKRVTPQPMVKQPAKLIIPKPDLKIEDLKYVAKSASKQVGIKKASKPYISFLVKNAGKGKIDRRDFNKIPLSIKINGRPDRSYTKLSQLVKYENIKDPGGMQRCIIPKQLDGRTRVEVEVNVNDAIDESRKENNRVSMLLGDRLLLKSQASKKKMGGSIHAEIVSPDKLDRLVDLDLFKSEIWKERILAIAGEDEEALAEIIPPAHFGEKTKERIDKDSEPATDSGWPIKIAPPYAGQIFYAGDTVEGRFRLTRVAEAGRIHFALVSGTPPDDYSIHAQTSVNYHPPAKKTGTGPNLPKSTMRTFEIPIPRDLSHSSNYKIVGYHSEHPWSFIGSSESFTIRPLVETRRGKFKKLDRSQQSERVLQDSRVTAERVVPGSTSNMNTQAPPRPGPNFPAEITSVNCPIAVGSSLSIHGHDFGRNEGHVDIALPGTTFSCEITEWSEEHVRCTVPISMGEEVAQSAREAVIWLKPARIEPPAPGTFRLPGPGGSSETPYYYSGEEGPRYICFIEPMVPDIDRLSRTDISPLQEVTIHGSNFGEAPGELQFTVSGDSYPYATSIISWSNNEIRMQLSDTTADPYGDSTDRLFSGEDRVAQITVTNSSGNSDSADITFIPGDESDYPEVDLHTSGVRITRRTVSGQRQLLIQITVENEEAGTTWRRIRIDLRGLDMAGWIEGGIGGHLQKIYTFVYNDSHTGDDLDFYVVLDHHNNIPETSTSNNECHVTWRAIDAEREYSCITM